MSDTVEDSSSFVHSYTSELCYIALLDCVQFDELMINNSNQAINIRTQVESFMDIKINALFNNKQGEDPLVFRKTKDGFIIALKQKALFSEFLLFLSQVMVNFYSRGILISGGVTYGTFYYRQDDAWCHSSSLITLTYELKQCQMHGILFADHVRTSFDDPAEFDAFQYQNKKMVATVDVPTLGYRINRSIKQSMDVLMWPAFLDKKLDVYQYCDVYEQYDSFVKNYGPFESCGSHFKECFKNSYTFIQGFCEQKKQNQNQEIEQDKAHEDDASTDALNMEFIDKLGDLAINDD